MQLNEILEENTIKGISQKTKISEDNLENLLAANFDALKKIKTLGFISILEREYKADLSGLREEALAYYSEHIEDQAFSVGEPMEEDKKVKSKLFLVIVLALLGYASWYFFTQFDKKHLSVLIPFMDEQMIETTLIENNETKKEITVEDLSIANVVINDMNTNTVVEDVVVQESTQISGSLENEVNVSVEPVSQF
ncbi:hypothetical protein [Sulfurovum sp.]|uniref:hypothetical protein n=1 Tax=Sulfurovum sp. TaxID=1969726 RepID=UPI00356A5831